MSQTREKLSQLIDSSLKSNPILYLNKGDQVEGKVIQINEKHYIININEGLEALLPKSEVMRSTDHEYTVGEEIKAYVLKPEDDYCNLIISQRRTGTGQTWDILQNAQKENLPIEVNVIEANTGGLIVNTEGVLGFIPVSQLDPNKIYNIESDVSNKEDLQKELSKKLGDIVGKKMKVMVVEADKEKSKLILSEKFALSDQNLGSRQETIKNVKSGDVLEGIVTAVTPYGIFVNANGLDGLVHLSEISWDRVDDPSKFARIGDKIQVKLIDINEDGTRVAYSIKQLNSDPWLKVVKSHKIGNKIKGTITDIEEFGLIVKVASGVNGLIHINEMPEDLKKDSKFKKDFKINDEVEATIITISPNERKMGLSLKPDDENAKETEETTVESSHDQDQSEEKNRKDEDSSKMKKRKHKRVKSKLDLEGALQKHNKENAK